MSHDEHSFFPSFADFAAAQTATDVRLVRYGDALSEGALERVAVVDRGEHGLTGEAVAAMLSGTRVEPPQLDEFFLEWDAPLRAHDPR